MQNETNDLSNNIRKFFDGIKNPEVDLKFFNDAVRTGINLGLAAAIGGYLLERAPTNFGKISGALLLSFILILLILNIFQLFSVCYKLFQVQLKGFPKTIKEWTATFLATILGIGFYIGITIIFAGNFNLILKNMATQLHG